MRRPGRLAEIDRNVVERAARILGDQSSAARALREADEYLRGDGGRAVAFLENLDSGHLLVVKSTREAL